MLNTPINMPMKLNINLCDFFFSLHYWCCCFFVHSIFPVDGLSNKTKFFNFEFLRIYSHSVQRVSNRSDEKQKKSTHTQFGIVFYFWNRIPVFGFGLKVEFYWSKSGKIDEKAFDHCFSVFQWLFFFSSIYPVF